jgi:preprotein translocase subunit Sec61beta
MLKRQFGKLTVVEYRGKSAAGVIQYLCVCDCGREKIVPGYVLRAGRSNSCSCIRTQMARERAKKRNIKSSADASLFSFWEELIKNQGNNVHPYWHRFWEFKEWSMSHGYTEGARLMRKDESDDFYGRNCYYTAP